MANYFSYFPKISYDIAKTPHSSNFELATNIMARVSIVKSVLDKTSSYYVYAIRDEDKPEILAEKIYKNAEAHWIILYANDMIDPFYDWPLNSRDFDKYIISKYGSIEAAQTTIHHYEKVVSREENLSGVVTEDRYTIDLDTYNPGYIALSNLSTDFTNNEVVFQGSNVSNATFRANINLSITDPEYLTNLDFTGALANAWGEISIGDYIYGANSGANAIVMFVNSDVVGYDYYANLAEDGDYNTYEVVGKSVTESIYREAVSVYDYEYNLNESKREIKIIKPEYYGQIMNEFLSNMEDPKSKRNAYIRKLI